MAEPGINLGPFIDKAARWFIYILMLGGLVASALSIVTMAGMLSPVLDLFSHFRIQYSALLFTLFVIALACKRRLYAIVFGVTSLCNFAMVAMLWIPQTPIKDSAPRTEFTILDMNLLVENKRADLMNAEIVKRDADIVVLEELNESTFNALRPSLKKYPYQSYALAFDPWGIGIFSKTKLENAKPNLLGLPAAHIAAADVIVGKRRVTIVGVHTVPQLSMFAVTRDKSIIEGLISFYAKCKNSVVMVGDFNATPWSEFFRQLIGSGKLIDSEQGYGPQPSWPSGIPFLQIPIDHCVFSPDCRAESRKLGDFTGSDHYPLILKLSISQS